MIEGTVAKRSFSSLLKGEIYAAHVSYTSKSIEELRKECDWISDVYDGRAWHRRPSCAGLSEVDGEREFLLATLPSYFLGKWIGSFQDELEAHVDELGYRFAVETEALSLARAHPSLLRAGYLLALGSVVAGGGASRCACIYEVEGRRYFGERTLSIHFSDRDRLLLVRT